MPPSVLTTLPARSLVRASSRAALLTLAVEDGVYRFRPGQAVLLGAHGSRVRKPYSIASSPADVRDRRVLEFLVGVDTGDVESRLDVSPGSPVDVEGPFGSFVLPDPLPASRVLLVAGGTGIAPLRSMWRHLVAGGAGRAITLAYSVRTLADVAFGDEIRDHVARRQMKLVLTVSRERSVDSSIRTGRFTREVVGPLVAAGDVVACVCGPTGFVRDVVLMLSASGVPAERIVQERWA